MHQQPENVFERHRILTGVCIAFLTVGFALAIAELFVRVFLPQVHFIGTNASLRQPDRFGATAGNRPLAAGESFGAKVVTDQFGFRVAADQPRDSLEQCTTIIIGDSVPYGVGVDAEHTFPTLIGQGLGQPLCNTAVPAYGIDDYLGIVDRFVIPNRESLGISNAILVVTLNDIHGRTPVVRSEEQNRRIIERAENPLERITRLITSIFDFNSFLNTRSKLYLAVKGTLFDSSRWWFQADYDAYFDAELVEEFTKKLQGLIEALRINGVGVQVLLLPYEYQVRLEEPEYLEPQRIISQALTESGVRYWNLYSEFVAYNNGSSPEELFLFSDHCHLTVVGHALVAEHVLQRLVEERRTAGQRQSLISGFRGNSPTR